MKVAYILEDCGINKGVLVSKKGFKESAVQTARYKNIDLYTLRKPLDKDKENRAWEINININTSRPHFNVIVDKETIDTTTANELNGLKLTGSESIIMSDGSKITMKELFNSNSFKGKMDIKCPNGTYLLTDKGPKIGIISVKKELLIQDKGGVKIRAEEYIDMIMEDVTGSKNIILTKDGEVLDKS